jgi:hypothetical protein
VKAFTIAGGINVLIGFGLLIAGLLAPGEARGGLLATGGFMLPFGLIFYLVGRKIGPVAGLRPGLIESGTPTEARVTGMRETSVRVNNRPVIGFDLEVTPPRGGDPYPATVKQVVPMAALGSIRPGVSVGVVVDPVDPAKVVVDWTRGVREEPARLSDADPEALIAAIREIPPDRRNLAAETLARGRRGRATITLMQRMGELVDLGLADEGDAGWEDDLFLVGLDVKLPGWDTYPAQILHRVPDALVGRIGPGREVEVAVDRDDPEHQVAIDWEATP